jgi:hypothetical protein
MLMGMNGEYEQFLTDCGDSFPMLRQEMDDLQEEYSNEPQPSNIMETLDPKFVLRDQYEYIPAQRILRD